MNRLIIKRIFILLLVSVLVTSYLGIAGADDCCQVHAVSYDNGTTIITCEDSGGCKGKGGSCSMETDLNISFVECICDTPTPTPPPPPPITPEVSTTTLTGLGLFALFIAVRRNK